MPETPPAPESASAPEPDGVSVPEVPPNRRAFLRWAGITGFTGLAALATGVSARPAAASTGPSVPVPPVRRAPRVAHAVPRAKLDSTFTPLRPPATPLAVRSPYLSTWLAADSLAGTWTTFWNGHVTAICGLARVDGATYVFCGSPGLPAGSPSLTLMSQSSMNLTGTQSTFVLTGGGVNLTVSFFSPVDPNNLQRQSVPFSYLTAQASSADGNSHDVQLYLDISGEWAHGDVTQQITWAQQTVGGLTVLTNTPASPTVLAEYGDQASWGTVVWATDTTSDLTWQIGQDTVVRAGFAGGGSLPDTVDSDMPRAINDNWPVFGFCRDLGSVTAAGPSATVTACVGHVRQPAVSYLGANLDPWWTTYWGAWTDMLAWFRADHDAALSSAQAQDARIQSAAVTAAGGGSTGQNYAALCALALRQAFGGTELVNYQGQPWAMLKEISSDGNVSTIDVCYPAFPAYLYLSPYYLQLLLTPIVTYCGSGNWPEQFCVHDLGSSYPVANGHNDGGGENMPIEESANMLIMCCALAQRLSPEQAGAFIAAGYPTMTNWAQYLVGNTLEPGVQGSTDDFTQQVANNVNLILKGIIGIGAMSLMAGMAGRTDDQASYLRTAQTYIGRWQVMAQDSSAPHLDTGYGLTGLWSLKYNGFSDRVLGLDLVPQQVTSDEAAWYTSQANGGYGLIFDSRYDYTKGDWELWTAGYLAAGYPAVRDLMVNGVYGFCVNTPNRVPFSDWYVVSNADQQGFQARPVVGGMYSLLLSQTDPAPNYPTAWFRIMNVNSGKVLAVDGQSLSDSANVTQWTDNGTPDHLWRIIDQGNGQVKIQNKNSGLLLAVQGASTSPGAYVQQYEDNGTSDHLWVLIDNGDGSMKLRNVNSGLVAAVNNMSTADGAQVTQWTDNGTPDHLWRLIPDGQVKIQNRNSGLLLAVHDASSADGAFVQQYHDNGTTDHLWSFADGGNSYLTIHNVNSGKVVAVSGQSTADGAQVTQWDDNGTPDHLWRLRYDGSGWWRVQNDNSGKVLGVDGQSTADSANVVQWDDDGSQDHLWRFVN